jgi:hypothetical protein
MTAESEGQKERVYNSEDWAPVMKVAKVLRERQSEGVNK